MTLSEELLWRGFVHQTTYADLKAIDNGEPITYYHGFDASADSQTIGNLAAMMFDLVFLRHGHKAIVLAGGATSLIGDPGGKDTERPMQAEETIRKNVENAEKQLAHIFRGYPFQLVNNMDWFQEMSVVEFLRDVGKYFGMSTLVQRDYIQKRIGEGGAGMSFTEFSYTLLQGYDFLHLYDKFGCTLQLAGSDQWGNSLSGVDLIRKTRGAEVNIITLPLVINKSTGKKFGKSEDGAVWLDADKTSVYKFYQFWLGMDDEGVIDYLKIYTTLDRPEIERLEQAAKDNPAAREAQAALAFEVTKLVHGEDRAENARNATAALFGGTPFAQLMNEEIEMLKGELPVTASGSLVNALVTSGIASSNGDARRLIEGGAVSVNGEKASEDRELSAPSLIKKGKNSFALVL